MGRVLVSDDEWSAMIEEAITTGVSRTALLAC